MHLLRYDFVVFGNLLILEFLNEVSALAFWIGAMFQLESLIDDVVIGVVEKGE